VYLPAEPNRNKKVFTQCGVIRQSEQMKRYKHDSRFYALRKLHMLFCCFVDLTEIILKIKAIGHNDLQKVFTICTTSLTFTISTFCPHSVFMCFVWISEERAIIPYTALTDWFL
jgi:hypothetical protein